VSLLIWLVGRGGVQGLLDYPDFYKVGVQGILHDSRMMGLVMWGGIYEGPGGLNSEKKYPEERVSTLRGKLLMMHGMLDSCCAPPAASFRLIEALQRANKDFDLVLEPKLGHVTSSYQMRRAWDFLVRHLQGVEPPKEFRLEDDMLGE